MLDNLRGYTIPNTQSFKEKAIRWYSNLLLGQRRADDQIGFDNEITVAYGMCPSITLREFYDADPELPHPSLYERHIR
jgi:hypothetical protein